jgi:hypothetical protein
MPYPYQIVSANNALLFSDARQAETPRPHYYGGYLFQVTVRSANPAYLDMYASDVTSGDPGSTWTIQDSGNSKRMPAPATPMFGGRGEARDGAILYYVIGSWDVPNRLKVVRFDMATRTWLSDITGGPDNAYFFDGSFNEAHFKIAVLANGDLFIAYQITKTVGTPWAQVNGVVYDVSMASWGTPFAIFEPDVTEPDFLIGYLAHFCVLGGSDRVHVVVKTWPDQPHAILHRTWKAGVLGAVTIIRPGPQIESDTLNPTAGVLYTFCGTTWVCLAYAEYFDDTQGSGFQGSRRLLCIMFPDEDNPTNWRRDAFYIINDGFNSGNPWFGASLATDGMSLYYVYSDWDTATQQWALRYFCLKQTKWAGPTNIIAMGADDIVDVAANFVNGQLGVSFMGYEGGAAYENPHYFQLTPTCNAAECCPELMAMQNRSYLHVA